jgi:transcriptional regulator GlxA family with amidase domain
VAVVAFDGVVAIDLILPAEAFGHTRLADGTPGYRVKLCASSRLVETTVCPMQIKHGLDVLRTADTIVIPGIDSAQRAVEARLLKAIVRAAARGARVASVCSGAFVFAKTGLLDGKRATTHWAAADTLQAMHPAIVVDPAVLYVDNGQFLTSAGGMAQLDLCLHMIRSDHGAAVAASAARVAVMPLERSGGQAQFIVHEPPVAEQGGSLAATLEWMSHNLKADLGVDVIARRAAMSERTLARKFLEQTGTTPAKWVTRARICHGQSLLETTELSVERVAEQAGFGSAMAFRTRFRELVGVAPADYRRSFRGGGSNEPAAVPLRSIGSSTSDLAIEPKQTARDQRRRQQREG